MACQNKLAGYKHGKDFYLKNNFIIKFFGTIKIFTSEANRFTTFYGKWQHCFLK